MPVDLEDSIYVFMLFKSLGNILGEDLCIFGESFLYILGVFRKKEFLRIVFEQNGMNIFYF